MEKKHEPMDASFREDKIGTMATNHKRVCWALKTLISEIVEVFPETENAVEYSDYDGRGAALTATIDLTVFDNDDDAILFLQLIYLVGDDHRVYEVVPDEVTSSVAVTLKSNPRTQDLRTTFNVSPAWVILALAGEEGSQ